VTVGRDVQVPSVVVEVEQEDGLVGVGLSTGGEAAAFIIENHLAMFVEGQNVRNISYVWEQMWRASIHYGRKGTAAASAFAWRRSRAVEV
jgi:L-rhamnonate dehydratase